MWEGKEMSKGQIRVEFACELGNDQYLLGLDDANLRKDYFSLTIESLYPNESTLACKWTVSAIIFLNIVASTQGPRKT